MKMSVFEWKKMGTGLLFISPWIAGFLILTLYPVGASLYYSFCDYDILAEPAWVGTLNYQDMLLDNVFWQSLLNTIAYAAFALPLGLFTSFFFAVLLNCGVRGKGVFRVIFFLPSLVPLVATAMIWLWIFNGEFGLLNYVLKLIGIEGPNWLGDAFWTKPALVLMSVWGMGNTIVIYLAALQEVPAELYEAADIDGAGFWGKLWHVTVPSVSPVIYFNLIMGIIGSLQIFAQPYIMFGGNGGPGRSALFYATYLYENAFSYSRMGYACAMAWVLFIIIIFLTYIATKISKKHIHYGA